MTGLLDTTNVCRSTSIQRKSLPTCTLSLASVSAHTGKHRIPVDLPHHACVQANVVPFPSVAIGAGGGAHALLRSSPPPVRPRPRISTSVTSSIRRKRSASRLTSPSSVSPSPTPTPPRKRARTTTASKSILKPASTPAPAPRRAPSAEIKLNACVYHTIFSLGLQRRAAAANKRRAATPRCTSPTPGAPSLRPSDSPSPRFDDSDDSDLDSEIEEELETAVHHAILEEQDITLSFRLRHFLLKNGVDPRGVFFQQDKEEREEEMEREEMGILDPFLKDEEVRDVNEDEGVKDMDSMDVEVESGTPSVPSSCTPVALRNVPPPPCAAEARVHFTSDLPSQTRSQPTTHTMSTSPPRPSSASPRPSGPSSPPRPTPKLKSAAPALPPPSHLTAILLLRHAAKERQRYRSMLARCSSDVEAETGTGTGRGMARGKKSPLRSVFSRVEEEEQEGDGDVVMDEEGSDGSVLEDVLMAMMVDDYDSDSEGRRGGWDGR